MSKSRRQFLVNTSLAVVGAALASCRKSAQKTTEAPAGTPPAFGTAPAVGPEVSPFTFAEAEKLVRVELTSAERAQAAGNWRNSLAPLYERRTGPRKVKIDPSVAPYSRWDPVLPGEKAGPPRDQFIWSKPDPGPLPANDEDIAYAPVTRLARWIEKRQLKSERLTNLYLERLDRFNPKLRCVITLMREPALAQAKQADQEISAGKYRGPLHGVPWGAPRIFSTPPGLPPLMAPSPSATACPRRTPPSSNV